jgi:hypothetical protein
MVGDVLAGDVLLVDGRVVVRLESFGAGVSPQPARSTKPAAARAAILVPRWTVTSGEYAPDYGSSRFRMLTQGAASHSPRTIARIRGS